MAENSGDILDEDHYFMAAAILIAKRSKDPNTKVGACIVDDKKKIVSLAYNGMPRGTKFPWNKCKDPYNNKYTFVCHAELNAIVFRNLPSLKGCTIYTTLFPWDNYAKLIIHAGITKVIYASDKYSQEDSTIAAKKLFEGAKIEYRPFKEDKFEIDFTQNQNIGQPANLPLANIESTKE